MSLLEQQESYLTELLTSISGKLITELQKDNLRLTQENASLRLSLNSCKEQLIDKKAIALKFLIMQDIVERMTALRIHRITLPYERKELDEEDEPNGIRLEISQAMLNSVIDERRVIDYSLYLPTGMNYNMNFLKLVEHTTIDSIDTEDGEKDITQNEKDNQVEADVVYVPCLQQRHFKDIEYLRKILPNVFFDMFAIQHDKLSMFYGSLQKFLTNSTPE
ncbi:uncharacterized protein HGUI_03304 [Hanseniaspora guilliermondii]|uniref:Monopolin complex subunit Csm1/Pcs1 C-terminal domain-containing protein n=1 Tax=Hanseniaspora guilliermondii TaxID=56406 RepID=A0A1L0B3N2_9ASCO|nr:uncharacterized protein HGUI_03304 [Hanseniaspora guilliermondii]